MRCEDMVNARALYYCNHISGWMQVVAALHCWLLISFSWTTSSSVSPLSVATAAAADATLTAPQCMQMKENAEKICLDSCLSQYLMNLNCPSGDRISSGCQSISEEHILTTSEIPPPIFETKKLREIAVDYTPGVCHHKLEEDEIAITFDERGGARWRTLIKFKYGTFSAKIKCPDGDTSGLNCSFYLSSLEGDKSQDEIDFEFLGKDKGIVQTNYYTEGTGNREQIHQLGFDCSEDFHEYAIKWSPMQIDFLIDGGIVRTEKIKEGEIFPSKSMFLYASVWNASYIDDGKWAGPYFGHDAPYICRYKNVHIPVGSEELYPTP
eukprot:Gb_10814 [translate_table: standard]